LQRSARKRKLNQLPIDGKLAILFLLGSHPQFPSRHLQSAVLVGQSYVKIFEINSNTV
jgi:hypothetical protein